MVDLNIQNLFLLNIAQLKKVTIMMVSKSDIFIFKILQYSINF